jgi:8-amino-7-oxononanoate synthase
MTDGASTKNRDIAYRNINVAKDLREMGIYPYFREISATTGNMVTIDGNELLMMGSNSYLGLTDHPEVKQAAVAAIEKYGTSCSGSRFLNGSLDIHRALEEELADFVGKPDALVFSTGFHANSGSISALVGKGDFSVTDKLDHASIIDGCLLSRGKMLRFRHNDMEDLEEVLRRAPFDRGKLVIVDGIFSMEGDIAPLPEIVGLCRRYNAELMVDDAHGIGVLGKNGAGTADHFGLTDDVKIIMGTFSKSLASLGGFIAADRETIDLLKHTARTMIFSASTTPSNVAAARTALMIMKREPARLERLWENTRRMMAGLQALGLDTGESETPIIAVRIGDTLSTFRMCTLLHEEGVFVNPVVAPAVPEGDCLIRVSLMATHTSDQIDFALDKIEKVGKSLDVI